jgi:transposase
MAAGGVEALAARPNLGRRPLLSVEQKSELARIVREGPRAAGFATELWTLPRLVKVIRERFGVTYHFSHVGRLLKKLGFTRQKPAFRATQRDEEAIARWRSHDWLRIKKRLAGAARPSFSSTKPAFCSAR